MFYALSHKKIDTGELEFVHILQDIETLNRWAPESRLEVTALSVHAYAYVAEQYALLRHGASIGERYGPIIVASHPMTVDELRKKKIAVPGELTTAFLTLSLCLGPFEYEVIPFDRIFEAVREERAGAGLIIHEGQLTYSQFGLHKVLDLGAWWFEKTSLPLPLGVNAVRKNLGVELCHRISDFLRQSIEYGLQHRQEAMEYAMQYARNAQPALADKFVGMYVNQFTRELGEKGTESILRLLHEGYAAGILPEVRLELV